MANISEAKQDNRPKCGAWAPGGYWHASCVECGDAFVGDKRAAQCADCAYDADSKKKTTIPLSATDTLAVVLMRIRKAHGLTQKDLAASLNVSPQYVCDLEQSRRHGSVDIVEAIVDGFGNGPKWRKVLHAIAARGHGWDV